MPASSPIINPASGGGGGGSVDSVNGKVGVVTLVPSDIISASNNQFIYQNNSGLIQGHPNLSRDATSGGTSQTLPLTPNNGGFLSLNTNQVNISPSVNSPNGAYTYNQLNVSLDNLNSGFNFGINNANAVVGVSQGFNHTGTGDVGGLQFIANNVNLGNGTDIINVGGFGYCFGFGAVNANVNINGPMQGYGFQPALNAAATVDPSSCFVNAFYDFFQATGTAMGFYTSYAASPSLGSIANNFNYTGFNLNPTIPTFTGNAGYTGIAVSGTLGTFGTGGFTGMSINPTVTSVTNANGLAINMTNVTATNKKAIDAIGDVSITGNLSFTGSLNIGQLNAFFQSNPVDGGGNPQTLHGLTSGMNALDSVTVANGDTIGVNTAMLIELEDNSVTTSGPFKLGFSATALPCVVKTGTGSSLDFMNMGLYALNLDATSTGGAIGRVNGVRVEAVPNASTTIDEFVAFEFNQTFGQVGTDVWGLHVVPTFAENFIGGSLAVGTASRKVTNSSVALEIGGVTRAIRTSVMDSTERDALTALAGMIIFNTTTGKHEGYDGTSWNVFY